MNHNATQSLTTTSTTTTTLDLTKESNLNNNKNTIDQDPNPTKPNKHPKNTKPTTQPKRKSKNHQKMFPITSSSSSLLRLLRLLPALSSTATLMFALDEHLIFGTWTHPSLRARAAANAHLPAWWTIGGLRWRWVIILGYPLNYTLGVLNLLASAFSVSPHHQQQQQLHLQEATATGSSRFKWWYALGLMFSVAHMLYARMALRLIADIENGVARGDVAVSMAGWLRMNWVRALTTDLPAWLCFVTAALKAL